MTGVPTVATAAVGEAEEEEEKGNKDDDFMAEDSFVLVMVRFYHQRPSVDRVSWHPTRLMMTTQNGDGATLLLRPVPVRLSKWLTRV